MNTNSSFRISDLWTANMKLVTECKSIPISTTTTEKKKTIYASAVHAQIYFSRLTGEWSIFQKQ